jgi:hypothetical protein|tara:strand:+ start:527 stop:856 length:330 start_codon:yes stop_codon:yes gene_type:complete
MASLFKNAGAQCVIVDNSTADVYTAPAATRAVLHAIMVSNTAATSAEKVTIKVTVDGGTTFRSVLTNGEVPPADSLQIDKPINLEPGDKIRIFGTATSLECFLSILELT